MVTFLTSIVNVYQYHTFGRKVHLYSMWSFNTQNHNFTTYMIWRNQIGPNFRLTIRRIPIWLERCQASKYNYTVVIRQWPIGLTIWSVLALEWWWRCLFLSLSLSFSLTLSFPHSLTSLFYIWPNALMQPLLYGTCSKRGFFLFDTTLKIKP